MIARVAQCGRITRIQCEGLIKFGFSSIPVKLLFPVHQTQHGVSSGGLRIDAKGSLRGLPCTLPCFEGQHGLIESLIDMRARECLCRAQERGAQCKRLLKIADGLI